MGERATRDMRSMMRVEDVGGLVSPGATRARPPCALGLPKLRTASPPHALTYPLHQEHVGAPLEAREKAAEALTDKQEGVVAAACAEGVGELDGQQRVVGGL